MLARYAIAETTGIVIFSFSIAAPLRLFVLPSAVPGYSVAGIQRFEAELDKRGWTRVSGPSVPCKYNVLLLPLNAGKSSRVDPSTASKPQIFCKIHNLSCQLWWSSQLVACAPDSCPAQSTWFLSCKWTSRSLVHVDPARPRPPFNSTQIFLSLSRSRVFQPHFGRPSKTFPLPSSTPNNLRLPPPQDVVSRDSGPSPGHHESVIHALPR